jgi:hypothetical protein
VSDWLRRRRRADRRLDRSAGAARALESDTAADPRARDPAAQAQRREEEARLREVLGRLCEADRRMWDRMAAGGSLRALAAAEGVPYGRVKRRGRALLAGLRDLLGGRRGHADR